MTDEELRKLFEDARRENAAAHEETRRLLREENAAAHAETRRVLRGEMAETTRVLREENAAEHEKTRQKFESAVEVLTHKADLLADGLQNLDEKIDRESTTIRDDLRRGFADTQAMRSSSRMRSSIDE